MTILGIDYSFSKPDPAQIKANGYTFVVRYLSRDLSKTLTASERDALWAHGLGISLVFEDSAGRPMSGAAAGTADGVYANQQADLLGFPRNLPIFYAVDFQVTTASLPIVLAYVQAAGKAGRRSAGYGSSMLIDYLTAHGISDDWQTCAWSSGVVNDKAVLYQRLKPTTSLGGGGFDEDIVLTPHPDFIWNPPSATPAPIPQPATSKEDDLMYLAQGPTVGIFIVQGNRARHIASMTDVQAYQAAGVPLIKLSDALINELAAA